MPEIPFIPTAYVPYVAGAIVLLVALKLLSAILNNNDAKEALYEHRRCDCGWRGQVSKHAPICRKCGSNIPG